MVKILVVYYSVSGNVRKAAESYVLRYGGDLLELKCLTNYSGFIGGIRGVISAITKGTPHNEPVTVDFENYDKIVVCGAVWGGSIASPVRAFLLEYGVRLKEVEYLISRGSAKNEYTEVFDEMDNLCKKKRTAAISLRQGETIALQIQ